jgi:putative flippase GtrA
MSCRLVTEAISIGLMNLAVVINFNDVIMKIIANIVVIILNFVFSKLFIFKGNKNENEETK